MTSKRARLRWGLLAAFAFSGCGAQETSESKSQFSVALTATTEDGEPLQGVSFALGAVSLGTTPASGRIELQLTGSEGQTLSFAVDCPEQFFLQMPLEMRLARTHPADSGTLTPISYRVTCTRRMRDIVVAVRGRPGVPLPVDVDGIALATTAPDGTAHVLVRRDRFVRTLEVRIDTHAHPGLRPRNPSRTFELSGRDAVLIFDPHFAPMRARPSAAPARHIPYRIE